MEYKTKGVCSMAIQYELDDEQKVHNVKFIGGCSGNTQGVAQTCRRNACKRSNCPLGRHSVWQKTNFMSRPACNSIKGSAFMIYNPGNPMDSQDFYFNILHISPVPFITQ